jgi:hypothetical protein
MSDLQKNAVSDRSGVFSEAEKVQIQTSALIPIKESIQLQRCRSG